MRSTKKKVWFGVKGVLLFILMLWTLFPVYWMLSLAIRENSDLKGGAGLLPHSFTLVHFGELFTKKGFGAAIQNSLTVTLIALVISLICAIPCAYIFSRARYNYMLRKPAMTWVLLTRVLPPIAFAIPLYTMMNKMNLMGTMIPIIASHVLLSIPFIIWFLISFFAGIPVDLEESAKVDGAGEFVTFYKIILPLIAPGVAAVTILSFMTSWNEYMYAVIFVQSPKRFTIPLILATMNSEQEVAQWGLIAAGGIMSLIPILIFVLFAQNYLISGLSNGAVKG
ncbi:MAG: carbohydrate ABC transporter permease [Lachnospiraceae bacterium]|jgi:multiple sugar transport system permease protein|nr:carbohydrate ABC transporter permease [Lachnospiraceae bacterium]